MTGDTRIWLKLRRNGFAIAGAGIILLLVVSAVFAGVLAPAAPDAIDLGNRLQPPTLSHPFGTDDFGRDILSRTIYGARISLEVGVASRMIALVLGGLLGIMAGYFGGKIDYLIMRLTDVMFAFPVLLFLIAVTAAFGPGLKMLFFAIGFVGWPPLARLMRAQTMAIRNNEYVSSARALGFSHARIIFRHVLPNTVVPLLVSFSMGMAAAIMVESSLSFIGLGAQPPTPSWGSMISLGREYLRTAPWMTFFPGLCIALTVLAFNLVGDALRDAFDPKMKV